VIVAHCDEGLRQDVGKVERRFPAKRGRGIVNPLAAGRGLISLPKARTVLSIDAPASMSAMLGRAGIRRRSQARIAAVVASLWPPAVSMIATVTPPRRSDCSRDSISSAR
jgi:hypothetical protein